MPKFKRATNNNLLTKVGKAGQVNGFNKNVNIGNSASSVQQDDEIASMSSSAGGDGCLNANFKNGNNNKQLKLKNGGASTSKNILNGSSKNVASKKKKLPKVKRTKANPAKNGCNGNTIITDYFQLRKSSRRTVAEIKAEQIRKFTDAVVYACEDDLEVREFPIKGRGVIAKRKFAHEEFVVEYRGELIESAEAQRREERYQKNSRIGCYILDATRESVHKGRLLNHSAKGSNLKSKILEVNNRPHVIFLAKRDIEAGEELLYDYGDRRKNAVEANPWLVRS
ncbi:N-lysine methyltransferase SETD8-A [Trichinella pseudospiralis]|uniref:N-lysine methyltransferase SETD8-A n=1 Tax=Trichinella pseudospiralis TaxID=6337 RepID=A0A0V1EKV2_TRIPS|nr:N-lysine methyltransferase SETD8-A [Trichinella pseudospiralis]